MQHWTLGRSHGCCDSWTDSWSDGRSSVDDQPDDYGLVPLSFPDRQTVGQPEPIVGQRDGHPYPDDVVR